MSNVTPPALIFAAGFGTRMGELTRELPKPMLKVGGRPMIDRAVDLLRDAGVQRLFANTHYLHELIEPHLQTLGVEISREVPDILDTGGGLRQVSERLPDGPTITFNPDAAWNGQNPVSALLDAWRHDMRCLLLVIPEEAAIGRETPGDFSLKNNRLQRHGRYVYTGAQIIDPALTKDIDAPTFSLNAVWDRLIAEDALHAVVYDGAWCDIGHPAGLAAAEALLSDKNV